MARYALGEREFASKKEAAAHVRGILHGTLLGWPIQGPDTHLLRALLAKHPGYAEKSAKGVAGFTVREVEFRPGIVQRCFFILHPDGSATDFSFLVALSMAPCGPTLAAAGRHAVARKVHDFKKGVFGAADTVPCAVTGDPIRFGESHVDHAPPWPFVRIVSEFVVAHGVPQLREEDGLRIVFADPAAESLFISFHDERALLRVVGAKTNMAQGAGGSR